MECRNCDWYKAKNCKHQCMLLPGDMTCGDCAHIDGAALPEKAREAWNRRADNG